MLSQGSDLIFLPKELRESFQIWSFFPVPYFLIFRLYTKNTGRLKQEKVHMWPLSRNVFSGFVFAISNVSKKMF